MCVSDGGGGSNLIKIRISVTLEYTYGMGEKMVKGRS